MGFEGRKIDDRLAIFGEPASGKALEALQRNSPTADSILASLPPSAFIPISNEIEKEEEKLKLLEEKKAKEEAEKEALKSATYRRERKKKRKKVEEKPKEVIVEEKVEKETTFIENIIKEKEETMDLEAELAALEAEVVAKKKEVIEEPKVVYEEEPQGPPQMKDQILELLAGEEDAPGLDTINAWKERYGKNGIHVMAFGEGDVYIYHHLTRSEWRKIRDLMARLSETQDSEEVEEKLKEKVVLYCTLYPSLDERWIDTCKAGVLDSLYQMILLNSGFLTPQQAMLLTTQL